MATHMGYLLKSSGGKKSSSEGVTGGVRRRNSLGNFRSKWERRYFVLDARGALRYYKKAANVNEG